MGWTLIDEGVLTALIPGVVRLNTRRARAKRPRFFVTPPAPCPYVPGRVERKLFTELRGPQSAELNEALSRLGFRRSQNIAYRPVCEACALCVSVRVPVAEFAPSASQRRLARRQADLVVTEHQPWTTPEQFALLSAYLAARHAQGGMAAMDSLDYADMVEQTPVDTRLVEYRDPVSDTLLAACVTDRQSDGLSLVYSFYDTMLSARSGLGTFMILDHIARARALGLRHVYLGYWIQGAARMAYKARFRPIERLTAQGWARD